MSNETIEKLIDELETRIAFHRSNGDDPHGIGNAVIAALSEVVSALEAVKE